jgi:hypothetical protein
MPIDDYFRGLFGMVAKPISEFMQGDLTGEAPGGVVDEEDPKMRWKLPPEMHALVKGGFCHGASLDWLRKVIQRDDPARYVITHRKWSRVSRMVNTHVENKALRAGSADRVDARAAAAVGTATSARDAAVARAKALLIEWAEGNGCTFEESADGMTIRNAPTPEIRAMIKSKFNEHDEMVLKAHAQLNQSVAAADATVQRWNTATPGERMEMSWSDIARQLGTDTGKKRTFSGITPAAGSSSGTYADLRSFVNDAVSAPAFIPGRGILISLSFVPEPGHSIAAHKESAESYVLFDPNLGIYRCKGLARFVTALVVLVEECYLTAAPGKAGTALGSTHSWHVFCRTGDLIPGNAQVNSEGLDDARIAFDGAGNARDSYAETTRFVAAEALEEAERLRAAYKAAKGPATQTRWVDAHNEAVRAVRRTRMTDAEATRAYSKFKRSTITLQ